MPLRAVVEDDWVIKKGNLTASLFLCFLLFPESGIAHTLVENPGVQKETNKILNRWQRSVSFLFFLLSVLLF